MVKRVIIEGTTDTTNGSLREGFSKLLRKKLDKRMPKITMGDGKSQSIDKFINCDDALLLCDLDGTENQREDDIKKQGLHIVRDKVYYMIQEMEAWFISQPDILDDFYGSKISSKIPKKHAKEFENPDEKLQDWTRDITKRGKYHKVRHGSELLQKLNADQLMKEFVDFKNLIEQLMEDK